MYMFEKTAVKTKSPSHFCSLTIQFFSQEATTMSSQMQKFGFNRPC